MGEKAIKVVLDTNFYISLLLKSQICALIFSKVVKKELIVFLCQEIIGEIFKVASYPRIRKYLESEEVFKLKNFLFLAENVILVKPTKEKFKLDDKDDQVILATALEEKVDYLVTRNLKDFAKAKKIKSLKIISPEIFLKILRKMA